MAISGAPAMAKAGAGIGAGVATGVVWTSVVWTAGRDAGPSRVAAVCPSPPIWSACRVSHPCLFIVMNENTLIGRAMTITTIARIGRTKRSSG